MSSGVGSTGLAAQGGYSRLPHLGREREREGREKKEKQEAGHATVGPYVRCEFFPLVWALWSRPFACCIIPRT